MTMGRVGVGLLLMMSLRVGVGGRGGYCREIHRWGRDRPWDWWVRPWLCLGVPVEEDD
jgi:hypothetical protein